MPGKTDRSERPPRPPGKAGGCGATAFGLLWTLFSLFITWMGARIVWGDWWKTRDWQEVEAKLELCEIALPPVDPKKAAARHGGETFQMQVRYRYEIDGNAFISARWRLTQQSFDDYEPLAREQARLRAARPLHCLVNPGAPGEAILSRRSESPVLMIGGLLFTLTGIGIMTAFNGPARRSPALTIEAASSPGPLLLGGAFVTIFLCAGLFVGWQGVSAMFAASRAKTWPEVSCEIVRTNWGRKSPSVLYRYTVSGETHLSDRIVPGDGMDSKSSLPRWKPGDHTTCRVDPDDPLKAVLLPDSNGGGVILFSVPFLTVGLFGWGYILWACRKARRKAAGADVTRPWFSSGSSRGKTIAGLVFINLFWNGIVSVFVTGAASGDLQRDTGTGSWFIWIFLTPFIVVGTAMLGFLLAKLIGLALPSARVLLVPSPVTAGEEAELSWEIAPSRLFRPRNVTLTLVADWKDNDNRDRSLPWRKPWSAVLWTGDSPAGTEKIRLPDPGAVIPARVLGLLNWSLKLTADFGPGLKLEDQWMVKFEIPERETAEMDAGVSPPC